MTTPGTNQVLRIAYLSSSARIRAAPMMPNSPREIGVGVVMPRATQPDIASRSKVRHAMCREIALAPLASAT